MRPDAPPSVSPYRALLGDDYDTLHPNVRAAHEAPLVAEGVFDVVHGSHLVVPVLIWIMKLPASGRSVPVHLQVVDEAAAPGARSLGMRWSRRIGRSILETHQFAQDDFLVEQSGAGSVVFVLHPADGSLVYERAATEFMGVPVPSFLSPRIHASVSPDPAGWHVDVAVHWRRHLICRYWGRMQPLKTT
ncbi:MAG TPA: DUF4166 domain-containing protein [Vicinamibacterales bacterium]|nr:DUF4166 domain-containing protein [Vicinamibacterales bacterium]